MSEKRFERTIERIAEHLDKARSRAGRWKDDNASVQGFIGGAYTD